MERVPFQIIKAAKEYDSEAVEFVFRHFAGYIESKCTVTYTDEQGHICSVINEDLRYQAELSLLSAIKNFSLREPKGDAD